MDKNVTKGVKGLFYNGDSEWNVIYATLDLQTTNITTEIDTGVTNYITGCASTPTNEIYWVGLQKVISSYNPETNQNRSIEIPYPFNTIHYDEISQQFIVLYQGYMGLNYTVASLSSTFQLNEVNKLNEKISINQIVTWRMSDQTLSFSKSSYDAKNRILYVLPITASFDYLLYKVSLNDKTVTTIKLNDLYNQLYYDYSKEVIYLVGNTDFLDVIKINQLNLNTNEITKIMTLPKGNFLRGKDLIFSGGQLVIATANSPTQSTQFQFQFVDVVNLSLKTIEVPLLPVCYFWN